MVFSKSLLENWTGLGRYLVWHHSSTLSLMWQWVSQSSLENMNFVIFNPLLVNYFPNRICSCVKPPLIFGFVKVGAFLLNVYIIHSWQLLYSFQIIKLKSQKKSRFVINWILFDLVFLNFQTPFTIQPFNCWYVIGILLNGMRIY